MRSTISPAQRERLIAAIRSSPPRRTSEVLAAAGITDRGAGDDAIWEFYQKGQLRIAPNSTLVWLSP